MLKPYTPPSITVQIVELEGIKKKAFTVSSRDIIEAQLKLDGKLIADVFTNGFRSIDEICMRLRHKIHHRNKKKGALAYTIINITKGLIKTIEREVHNPSIMV